MKRILVACLCVIFLASPALASGTENLESLLRAGVPKDAVEVIGGDGRRLATALASSVFPFPVVLSIWQHKANKAVYMFTLLPDIDEEWKYVVHNRFSKDTILASDRYTDGRHVSWVNRVLMQRVLDGLQKLQERPIEGTKESVPF